MMVDVKILPIKAFEERVAGIMIAKTSHRYEFGR